VSENLDLVRAIYADWNRGDYTSATWADADIEWDFVDWVGLGSGKGMAALRQAWFDFLRTWEELHNEGREYRELDAERVLVLTHFWGRGRGSGVELGRTGANGASLLRLRKGKVVEIKLYATRERALADLDLTQPDRAS
jgi:hypothetical protein